MEARTRLRNKAATHRLPQAERMGSMPLHNLTHVRSASCESRQVASYPSADEAGYGSVHTLAKTKGNYPPPATGRADGIYAAAQSHDCEIGHLPKWGSSILPVSRRGGIWKRARACQTWHPPTACLHRQSIWDLRPTPLHNLTPVRLSTCQSRQAPSYLSSDKVRYGSAHTLAK
jgi:hypothetical protein